MPPPAQRSLNLDPKTWASLFKGNTLTAKGNSLTFITPIIVDGTPMAVLDKDDIDKMTDIWENDIILYVVGDLPSIGAVIRFNSKEWSHVYKPQVFLHEEGYFVARFVSRKDRDFVVMAGPYTFFGRPLIVKPWAANFNFQVEELRVVHVWVRLPNLPLMCWGSDSVSSVGSLVGAPLFATECTS